MSLDEHLPRRTPRSKDRVLAGVAGGWADRWQVEPTVLRCCIGILTLTGGVGIVVYGVMALLSTPSTEAKAPHPEPIARRNIAIVCATAAMLVELRATGFWPGDGVMAPAAGVAAGIAAIWSTHRRGETTPGISTWTVRVLQGVAGVALFFAGIGSLAKRTGGLASVGASASAIAVVVGGLAMLGAPAIGRLLRNLDDERALRIREDERATMAAHLHDSVLQSLVLLQRTDDPRRMASIARRQERELRAWLYSRTPQGEPQSLHAAIDALTVEIEADHDVRVEAVVVGDQPLDDASRALVAAIRESLVNAARHADVDRVDVFVEADDTELTGYVRDAGRGFDPGSVPEDRRGISESIVGRAHRAGGIAVVSSEPTRGTEVEIRIPRPARS